MIDKLSKAIRFETALDTYTTTEVLGQGGAGIVYGGTSADGLKVAIKTLSKQTATTDKRRRFKNEIAFLSRSKHVNIVSLTDYGTSDANEPFYVMPRYDMNFRDLLRSKTGKDQLLQIFMKVLDGVEAAHLLGAIHRDLKPENILFNTNDKIPAICDFGIASLTADVVATLVDTEPSKRLANFQYAAPEQRVLNGDISRATDIYALGLMLNEIFTSNLPHGTAYRQIGQTDGSYAFLDEIVAKMIRQEPSERYGSVLEVKAAIVAQREEFLTLQRLSAIDSTVIPAGQIDEPLAFQPPNITSARWDGSAVRMTLDRPVNQRWVSAFLNSVRSWTVGVEPQRFHFDGNQVVAPVPSDYAQAAVSSLKGWLPIASGVLKHELEQEARMREAEMKEKLKRERVAAEQLLKINQSLKI